MRRASIPAFALACVTAISSAAPAHAATLPQPPELADRAKYQTNEEAVVLDTPLAKAWVFWRGNDITDFLEPTDRIPGIESFTVLEGQWGEVGAVRRVNFVGGGSALERILTSEEGEFTYQIWNIETASGRFIDHIYGEFHATQVAEGTQITWRYNVKPATFIARPSIRSFLKNDFDPFMEKGMQGMVDLYETRKSN